MSDPNAQSLFRLRVRYRKTGRLAYLGHLEVIHTIERIVRRAGLPYAVTQGFSPHMRVGFSLALPVGTSSTCEWYDLFLTDLIPAPEAFERLLAASPVDLAPDLAAYIDVKAPALTAQITRCEYRVLLHMAAAYESRGEAIAGIVDALISEGPIEYQRGRKFKKLDLAGTIASFDVAREDAKTMVLTLDTRVSNERALRPEILLAALDRRLVGGPFASEPIVSTGIQDLISIERYDVCRISQHLEDENATLRPVLEVFDVPSRPVAATHVPSL